MIVSIDEAAQLLNQGKVVAIPTETVYGLAASIHHEAAIENIFHLKKRSRSNPLIIHVQSKEEALEYMDGVPDDFEALTKAFWPGALTLILPVKKSKISSLIRAGLDTAAFRFPAHPITQAIIAKTGPLVAPSANLSGKPSGTCFEHIEHDFGKEFPVVEGATQHGLESTILALDGVLWMIGRKGAIPAEAFEKVLGYVPQFLKSQEKPICPGQHFTHYAPNARLVLSPKPIGDVVVGFSDRIYPDAKSVFSLGSSKAPEEIASNLYKILRLLDKKKIVEAHVDMNFPDSGLYTTIRERLTRAAGM